MANSVVINIVAKVAGLGDVEKFKSKLNSLTTSKGFKNAVTGVGIGIGISAWNGLKTAIEDIPRLLFETARAAADDEKSQARLYQSIRQNAEAWDGNVAAIEEVLLAREKLAFSDDEQRDSLAILVAYTKDVGEALEIEAAAMDLARLKGIGLAEASKAIVMGMEGSGRALKDLGINVKDVTDKTEVLRKVQEKAGGQAAAYADTAAGTFESLQITMDEISESIGYVLLPYLKDLAKTLRDDIVPNVDQLGVAFDWLGRIIDPIGGAMGDFKRDAADAAEQSALLAAQKEAEGATWHTFRESVWDTRQALYEAGKAADGAAGSIDDVTVSVEDARNTLGSFRMMVKDAARELRDNALDTAYDAKRLPHEINLAKDDVVQARKDLEQAQTRAQKDEAAIRLLDAEQNLEELNNQSRDFTADYGLTGKALGDALGGQMYDRIVYWTNLAQNVLRSMGTGAAVPRKTTPTKPNVAPERPGLPGSGGGGRASGGPVTTGSMYVVGEKGPEIFVPKSAGMILPNRGASAIAVTVPVTVTSVVSVRDMVVQQRKSAAYGKIGQT